MDKKPWRAPKYKTVWLNETLVREEVGHVKKLRNGVYGLEIVFICLWLGAGIFAIGQFKDIILSYSHSFIPALYFVTLLGLYFIGIWLIELPMNDLDESTTHDYMELLELKTGMHAWED